MDLRLCRQFPIMDIHDLRLSPAVDVFDGEGAGFIGVAAGDFQNIVPAQTFGGEEQLLCDWGILARVPH